MLENRERICLDRDDMFQSCTILIENCHSLSIPSRCWQIHEPIEMKYCFVLDTTHHKIQLSEYSAVHTFIAQMDIFLTIKLDETLTLVIQLYVCS